MCGLSCLVAPSYHKPCLENPLHGCGLLGFSFDMEPQVLGGLPFQEEGRETCECRGEKGSERIMAYSLEGRRAVSG